MRQLFFLLLLVLLGAGAYFYFVDASLLEKHAPQIAALIPRAQKEAIAAGVAAASTVEAPSNAVPAPATTQVVSLAPGHTAVVTTGESASPRPLDTFKLKNGTTIVGRVIVTDPDMTWIRTEDGSKREVKTRDIVSGLPRTR